MARPTRPRSSYRTLSVADAAARHAAARLRTASADPLAHRLALDVQRQVRVDEHVRRPTAAAARSRCRSRRPRRAAAAATASLAGDERRAQAEPGGRRADARELPGRRSGSPSRRGANIAARLERVAQSLAPAAAARRRGAGAVAVDAGGVGGERRRARGPRSVPVGVGDDASSSWHAPARAHQPRARRSSGPSGTGRSELVGRAGQRQRHRRAGSSTCSKARTSSAAGAPPCWAPGPTGRAPARWRRTVAICGTNTASGHRLDNASARLHSARMSETTAHPRDEATFTVKAGLAEMLKGGVIMDVVTPEQAQDRRGRRRRRGDGARARPGRHPARRRRGPHVRSGDDQGDPGGGHDPGDGQGADRPLRRGAGARGARGRLHRRVRGADPGRRGQPHRQVGLQGPVRVRRDEPRRGAAPDRRGRGDDPLQGRGRHRRHRRGGPPPAR